MKIQMPSEKARKKMAVFRDDGALILVVRPSDPKRALEIVRAVGLGNSPEVQKRWEEMHDKLNAECGPYKFVGFCGNVPTFTGPLAKFTRRKAATPILDVDGNQIDECHPGDSFVRESFFEHAERIEPA